MKDEDIPLPDLLLEYKLKLRFAKITIWFLVIMYILTTMLVGSLLKLSGNVQYKLGESVGISETYKAILDKAVSSQNSAPQAQFQVWRGGELNGR